MCSATVWIISGPRSRGKNVTALAAELFYHEHGSSSRALGFHECDSGSGALFLMAQTPALASVRFHIINILNVLVCLKLNGK